MKHINLGIIDDHLVVIDGLKKHAGKTGRVSHPYCYAAA